MKFDEFDDEEDADSQKQASEPEEEIDSSEFFCRFTPMQFDRMATHLLGERPICEKWISRDGKTAMLYPLILGGHKGDPEREFVGNMVERWKQRFEKK